MKLLSLSRQLLLLIILSDFYGRGLSNALNPYGGLSWFSDISLEQHLLGYDNSFTDFTQPTNSVDFLRGL